MGGDERRPLAAHTREGRVEPPVDTGKRAAADCDCVRGEERVEVVVGQLEPGQEQQVVLPAGALGLRLDLCEVVGVVRGMDASERCVVGQPRIVAAVDVVGDAEDVEAVASVQVDELGQRERAVAPPRVGVELAEQRLDLAAHRASSVAAPRRAWAKRW